MKKVITLLGILAVLGMLTGCYTVASGPILAPIQVSKGALAVGDTNVKASKTGKAGAMGIILVGVGDASISAAAANGGISKIHHVDTEQLNILGIYSKNVTIVYGE